MNGVRDYATRERKHNVEVLALTAQALSSPLIYMDTARRVLQLFEERAP